MHHIKFQLADVSGEKLRLRTASPGKNASVYNVNEELRGAGLD